METCTGPGCCSASAAATCSTTGCRNYAAYRFTWPGKDESAICTEHVDALKGTASAIGLYLQVIPLTIADHSNVAHPLSRPVSPPSRRDSGVN